jgi:hypothetical protein
MTAKGELPQHSPNLALDEGPAYITSVTTDLKSASSLRLDGLGQAEVRLLPTDSPYPKCTTGVMLLPSVDVQVLHGRNDGQFRLQVASPSAIFMSEVTGCQQLLFDNARDVRIHCLEIYFKVGDIYADGYGVAVTSGSTRRPRKHKRDNSNFRRNATGLPWHAEWDEGAFLLRVRVVPDRYFLTQCGLATLRDVVCLRQLKIGALLSPEDVCQLPVPWNFSKSREVLTARLQRMLKELCF